jgi:hypothetical protein
LANEMIVATDTSALGAVVVMRSTRADRRTGGDDAGVGRRDLACILCSLPA